MKDKKRPLFILAIVAGRDGFTKECYSKRLLLLFLFFVCGPEEEVEGKQPKICCTKSRKIKEPIESHK